MGVFCKKVAFFYTKIVLFSINGVYLYQQRNQYLNNHKNTTIMNLKNCTKANISKRNLSRHTENLKNITVIAIDGGQGHYITAVQIKNNWIKTVINGIKPTSKIVYLKIDATNTNFKNDSVSKVFASAVSEVTEITSHKQIDGSYGTYSYSINDGKMFSFRASDPYVHMLRDAFSLNEEQKRKSPLFNLLKNK